jgi:hypothetical protein
MWQENWALQNRSKDLPISVTQKTLNAVGKMALRVFLSGQDGKNFAHIIQNEFCLFRFKLRPCFLT